MPAAEGRCQTSMDKKFSRKYQPGTLAVFAVLLAFSIPGYFIGHGLSPWLGIGQTVVALGLFLYWRGMWRRRSREMMRYVDSLSREFDSASKSAAFSIPIPVAVAKIQSDELVWCNQPFMALDETREYWFSSSLVEFLPDFSYQWLLDGQSVAPSLVTIKDRTYRIYGCMTKEEDERAENEEPACALFFMDVTHEREIEAELAASRAVVLIIQLDNYDEITKSMESGDRTIFLASVDAKISGWAQPGVFLKAERDKYFFICEKRHFDAISKFEILDLVRELPSPGNLPATLSIGAGCGGASLRENLGYARLALDMSLSRGGDQAVVKDPNNYTFFGGRSREVEQRTHVRARVVANALSDMIRSADRVILSGHTFSDMDAIGAAVGLACACRKLEREARIVIDLQTTTARPLYERLISAPEYREAFVSPADAEALVTPRTLLIIVDVNRASFVDASSLLGIAQNIVVIDHHRRVADYIENPALSMHEPYASSTCELVSELLQYILQPSDVLRAEAEAMLAGISLDTKNFTMKTGVRTFEAAAFLCRAGADTITVKQLFANDMDRNRELCEIVRTASRYRDSIAIAFSEADTSREIGGQAADDLLNIRGIQASFVIFRHEGSTQISARSLGQINVQLIMEKIGGGGSLTSAGAQLGDKSVEETADELRAAIENYFTQV